METGTGAIDPRNPADAIFTAAHGLRDGKGLPALGEATEADYRQAACGYYGACAGYADVVLQRAAAYGGPDWLAASGTGGGLGCAAAQGGTGTVRIAPGANRPGVPLAAATLGFLRRVAAIVGHPITVTTGIQPLQVHGRRARLRPLGRPRRRLRNHRQRRGRRRRCDLHRRTHRSRRSGLQSHR